MSSGIDFKQMGICVLCFENDQNTPGGQLHIDADGDTLDVCCDCQRQDQGLTELLKWSVPNNKTQLQQLARRIGKHQCWAVPDEAKVSVATACWLPPNHFQPHRAMVPNPKAGQPNQPAELTHTWE